MKKHIDNILGVFLVILMAVMVIAVLWQVLSRYVMQSPSSVTEELARFLLIWIGILGAAYVAGQQEHLSINLLEESLDRPNRKKLMMLINFLIIFFGLTVLIIGGGNLVYVNYLLGQSSAALEIPLYVVYLVIPISGFLIVLYKVNEIMNPEKYLV